MAKQFQLVILITIFSITKLVNSQIEENYKMEFECENGVPLGWENTGTQFTCAEDINGLPVSKPGEFQDLIGNGIWYWNGNESPSPSIRFASVENQYSEYNQINISFRYYAFGSPDTLKIEVKPIHCPEFKSCDPSYLPPSFTSKEWLIAEYEVETSLLPIEIIGILKVGQWLLLDALTVSCLGEIRTTVTTSTTTIYISSTEFPYTSMSSTAADTTTTENEEVATTEKELSSLNPTTLSTEYSTTVTPASSTSSVGSSNLEVTTTEISGPASPSSTSTKYSTITTTLNSATPSSPTTVTETTHEESSSSFHSTSTPKSSTTDTPNDPTTLNSNFWFFAFIISIGILGIFFMCNLIYVLHLLVAKKRRMKDKSESRKFEGTEKVNYESKKNLGTFPSHYNHHEVSSKIIDESVKAPQLHLYSFNIPRPKRN